DSRFSQVRGQTGMIGRLLIWAAAATLCLSMQAGAQTREVEVFYDRYGREVLVDIYTGEVVAVREPRGSIREYGVRPRERWGDSRDQDGYYLDQRDYEARLRRERRLRELERDPYYGDRLPEYDDYR